MTILTWLVALEGLSLAAWPLARLALPRTVDRGWAASRVIGLMLVSLAVGSAATLQLVPFDRATLIAFAVLGGALVWAVGGRELVRRWPPREALVGEAVFLGTFALAIGLRVLFPSVDNNERPMDFAFLNAFVRGDALPPPDPWFAGQPIAYYTLGYLSWAAVTRIAGVPVELAYNLAVASVFAVAVALVWATAASWRARVADGFLAAAALALVGNLRTLADWLITVGVGTPEWWASWAISPALAAPDPGWAFWMQPSRVTPNLVPYGINEFPFFSLIVGDLHPHYMAMAANILAVALALAAVRGGPLRLLLPLGAASVATLATANTWNVPAAAAILLVGLASRFVWPTPRPWKALALLGAFALTSALLAAPLLRSVSSPPLSLALTSRDARLWPGTFVVLYLPYVLGLLAVLLAAAPNRRPAWLAVAGWSIATVAAEALAGAGAAVFLVGVGVGLGVTAVGAMRDGDPVRAGLLATCALATGLIVVPDFIFLNDYFGSPMNTVFKFDYQALLFLAVGLPPLVATLPRNLDTRVRQRLVVVARKSAVYASLLTLLYLPLAPFTRLAVSPPGGSLDALGFLGASAPDDLLAINWLRDVAPPGSVILEATDEHEPSGRARSDVARISAFSGQPTLLGWREHERQWRGPLPAIDQRVDQADAVFEGGSLEQAEQVLEQYQVKYVVVGRTEHARYGQAVDERFRDWLEPAFRSGQTTVYRVPEHILAGAAAPQ